MEVSVLFAFGSGVLSFFSPCILPLIPAYISFITGLSLKRLQELEGERSGHIKDIILPTLLFILGFSFIFISLGASASFLGKLITTHREFLRMVGGGIIILFGLHLTGILKMKFLERERKIQLRKRPPSILGTFLIGSAFALGWTPCVGPILGTILTYAAVRSTLTQGVILLSFYSLGLAIPFFLTALAIGSFLHLFKKIRRYLRTISIITGLILIAVGILLLAGRLTIGG